MANVGMVFLSAVSAWCWSICRSWSRGIWEPLFHTNELHDFQPTISMFFALEGETDELQYIVTRSERMGFLSCTQMLYVCTFICEAGLNNKCFCCCCCFFAGPVPAQCPLQKTIFFFFCMGGQENIYKTILFHWPHDGEVLYCLN